MSAARVGMRHLILIGFMATGKSTVGRLLASELAMPFVDLDAEIEGAAGASARAIFEEQGEEAFRRLESEALDRALAGPPAVIATGGGAPHFGDNLERMRASGLVAAVTAPLRDILARVPDPSARPLLSRPRAEVEALYHRRLPGYRRAHVAVETSGRDPADAARALARVWRAARALPEAYREGAVFVSTQGGAYPVVVARGALEAAGELSRGAAGLTGARAGIVADESVAPLYAARAERALASAGFEPMTVTVPSGESSKRAAELERVCEELVLGGIDRRDVVVALGGGVVGDLAGFAAASLHRGVPVVQVPTTLLAMIDAAIGGKTGINLAAGKNLVGAFWQPSLVLADTAVLATLPARELRAAYGELLKYALLDGEDLYAEVEAIAPAVAGGEAPVEIEDVVRRCAAIKAWIVGRDEREATGERALLNLGHTIGHALEAATGYASFLHGEAVALGLVAACRVSARLGLCDESLERRVAETLGRAGLAADVTSHLAREDVLERVGVDKKRRGAELDFVAVRGPGQPELRRLEVEELKAILRPG